MKVVIVTAPMKNPQQIYPITYPADGNKTIEYGRPVRCPINGVLAKTLQKDEQVKIIYIMTKSDNSECEDNKKAFIEEFEDINKEIGAILSYDTVEIDFEATKQTYNKLIADLAAKIPDNAELYTDITFGFKTEILSLFCALRFVEEFKNAVVQYIVYGKVEFKKDDSSKTENHKLFDITSLYYLFKLMGTMGAADADTATKTLKDFFAM